MRHDGKKLLILGATPYSINVIDVAHKLGAYVVAVDPVKNSCAKKFADKAYDADTTDLDSLSKIIIDEKIDGIFVGYSDVNLPICKELCDRFGFPFYATSQQQLLNTTDKLLFKNMCRKYDVGTVPQYDESQLKNINYPIIIKPADSYGSKGITVCYNFDQTADAIQKAKKYSKTNQIIIEKYMGGLDDVNIDYIMQDGEIILTAVGDRYVNTEQKGLSPLTSSVVYPSKHLDKYLEKLDGKVKKMFYNEGMHNGTVFIQSFFDGEEFYFFEMGYRVGGGQSSLMVKEMCGIDYVENLIHFALCGKMDDRVLSDIADPAFSQRACSLVPILRGGIVGNISGIDEILNSPECVNITQFYQVGDEVVTSSIGNLGQSFARIHLVADTWESLNEAVNKANNLLHIESSSGEDMIIPGGFDGKPLLDRA